MNLVQKGRLRDNDILSTIEDYRVMNIHQVRVTHFPIPWGERKAQERMKKLADRGKVIRWRGNEGYCYAIEEKPGHSEHTIMLNWVRIWIIKKLKSWERIHCFLYEPDYKFIRPDAFVAIHNKIADTWRFYFIEMDRSLNKWDKVVKYNKLFNEINSGKFDQWWIKLTNKFPSILCVTTTESRKKIILQHVQEENDNGLCFDVKLLDEIKGVLI